MKNKEIVYIIEKWKEKIKEAEVISFDIFDTIIKRNVSKPVQIFDFVEEEYNNSFPTQRIEGFKEARIRAEKKARECCISGETTLREIYNQVEFKAEVREQLMQIEIEKELYFCEPNIPVVDFYRYCLKEGKRIVITSDMYLPKTTIEEILKKCGIFGYERLYLSSEIGEQKASGKLFDYVINDLGVNPNTIIHVGDRKKSDNIIPRRKGMQSIYVDHFINYLSFNDRDDLKNTSNTLLPFLNNNLPKYRDKSEVFQWGYEAFGPLLVGFSNWVHSNMQEQNIQKAFFLARDMYLVIQIYRMYYGDEEIDIKYLEVSRRSMRIAYVLKKNNLEALFDTMPRKTYSVSDILSSMGLSWTDISDDSVLKELGIDESTIASEYGDNPTWFGSLSDVVLSVLKGKKDNAIAYLTQENFFDKGNKAIIDIGWHASTQNILEVLCGEELSGLYFGNSKRRSFKDMNLQGYWYSFDDERDALPYLSMTYILEIMLFPNKGTTLSYTIEEGKVQPVYDSFENNDYKLVNEFQRGAMQFAEDYYGLFSNAAPIDKNDAIRGYKRLAFKPSLEQARTFAGISYEEGILSSMSQIRKRGDYIKHLNYLFKDYAKAKWKEGFLKQVFPSINNPHIIDVTVKKLNHTRKRTLYRKMR